MSLFAAGVSTVGNTQGNTGTKFGTIVLAATGQATLSQITGSAGVHTVQIQAPSKPGNPWTPPRFAAADGGKVEVIWGPFPLPCGIVTGKVKATALGPFAPTIDPVTHNFEFKLKNGEKVKQRFDSAVTFPEGKAPGGGGGGGGGGFPPPPPPPPPEPPFPPPEGPESAPFSSSKDALVPKEYVGEESGLGTEEPLELFGLEASLGAPSIETPQLFGLESRSRAKAFDGSQEKRPPWTLMDALIDANGSVDGRDALATERVSVRTVVVGIGGTPI